MPTITNIVGRNGIDIPVSEEFPQDQAVDLVNADLTAGGLGSKRNGSTEVVTVWTGGTAFTTAINALLTYYPSMDASELWAIDAAGTPLWKRHVVGTTTWADVTVTDAVTSGSEPLVHGTTFNQKFQLSYASSQSRHHVYDTGTGGTSLVRRSGIAPGSNAPTVANTGAGAYAAVLRYYRVRWALNDGSSVFHKLSEPTPSVSFTPSGAGTAARITKPTTPTNEDVNVWIVEASTDNIAFFVVAAIDTGTTTYDDAAATTAYAGYPLSYPVGYCTLLPNYLATVTDNNRLLGINGSRFYWGPIVGVLGNYTTGAGGSFTNRFDDERIVQTSTQFPYLDLNASDGGNLTAIARAVNGEIYLFKRYQTWVAVQTGDAIQPYIARKLSDSIGCVGVNAVNSGEDEQGNPCLYFWSTRGPYRIGLQRELTYMGRDIEDLTLHSSFSENTYLGASQVAIMRYVPSRHLLLCWWSGYNSSGVGDTFPSRCLAFFPKKGRRQDRYGIRGGWVRWTGVPATARCATVFETARTVSGNRFRDLGIWIGASPSSNPRVYEIDTVGNWRDDGTHYSYQITLRHPGPFQPEYLWRFRDSTMLTQQVGGVGTPVFTHTTTVYHRDSGSETITTTQSLPSLFNGIRLLRFEGVNAADVVYATLDVTESTPVNQAQIFYSYTITPIREGEA